MSTAQIAAGSSVDVQFGPMEIVFFGALVILLLAVMYRAGAKKDSFVREYSRGSFLRELNQRLEVEPLRFSSIAGRRLPPEKAAIALAAMAMIALVDAQTGQISLWPLYLAPVIFLSWVSGFAIGALTACLAGALLVTAVLHSGHPYENNYFFALATISHIVALLVVAWLANRAAAANGKRHAQMGQDHLNGSTK